MDPYLESPKLWPDVHHSLISGIRQSLNPRLRPKYVARIEERVYISDETDLGRRVIVPDLLVATTGREGHFTESSSTPGNVAEAIKVVELIDQEIHEPRLEILDAESREVVTVIEILSPTNKIRGSEGRRDYLKKRRQIIRSNTHLVEIDLLRDGDPAFVGQTLPLHHYGVYRSRFVDGERAGLFWPILLTQRLPVIDIPLHNDDPDVLLDLQLVLNDVYETAAYDMDIKYDDAPQTPLPADLMNWADELSKTKGLR